MKLNKAWHEKHPMPPKATFAQRVKWHLAHAKHCASSDAHEAVGADES